LRKKKKSAEENFHHSVYVILLNPAVLKQRWVSALNPPNAPGYASSLLATVVSSLTSVPV